MCKEYLTITNINTCEVLCHELSEKDIQFIQDEFMLYQYEKIAELVDSFDLNSDDCVWFISENKPKIIEI